MTLFIKQKGDSDIIESTVNCLSAGGIVLLPTDTVYGLAVLPKFEKSVVRLYSLKGRPQNMNLPIMVASADDLEKLGFIISSSAKCLLQSPLIPGSLTLVMGFHSGDVPNWLKGRDEAAVRIPDEKYLLSVLKIVGPLLVTSANLHGSETPEKLKDVLAQLNGAPDLAIEGGILHTIPSTLVNCRTVPPVIERIGAIAETEVMEYLK